LVPQIRIFPFSKKWRPSTRFSLFFLLAQPQTRPGPQREHGVDSPSDRVQRTHMVELPVEPRCPPLGHPRGCLCRDRNLLGPTDHCEHILHWFTDRFTQWPRGAQLATFDTAKAFRESVKKMAGRSLLYSSSGSSSTGDRSG
jgi:hypothetical protein